MQEEIVLEIMIEIPKGSRNKYEYDKKLNDGLGISSIAATSMELLGFIPPEDYDKSVLNWK